MRAAATALRKLVVLIASSFVVATITAACLGPKPVGARCSPPLVTPAAASERAPPDDGSAPAEEVAESPGPGADTEPQSAPPARPKRLVGTLNLNTAGLETLELLPGVGPAKAARIVAFRERRGDFERLVDLRRVRGFGRKTVRRLLPYLTLDGETTLRRE